MIELDAAARSSSKEGIGCQLTASPPSYLKANPIKIIILTSAPHQACLDDTSTQAKRTSICQCLSIEKRFYFNRMDCDFRWIRAYVTSVISSHPRRGIHLAVGEREIVLHSTTLSLPIDHVVYVKLWKLVRQFFVHIDKTECEILKITVRSNECSRILGKQAARWVIVTEIQTIKNLLPRILPISHFFMPELGR